MLADVRERTTDLGEVVLAAAVPLRVRPLPPVDAPWRGPLPRPLVRRADDARAESLPTIDRDGEALSIDGLPPGRYVLMAPDSDEIVADPQPFELVPGVPLQLDWPFRVGRRVTLRFARGAAAQAEPADVLHVVVRDSGGNEVLARDVAPGDGGDWTVRHLFAPGRYVIDASSRGGLRFHDARADTAGFENDGTYDVPRAR